jgi:hypothetical protein
MYLFKLDYPYEELKFYDHYPLVYIFNKEITSEKKIIYYGLNFHFLPVPSRKIWFSRIAKMFPKKIESDARLNLDYQMLFSVMKKSVFGVRKYRADRIKKPRIIPNENMKQILEIANRTYFGVTLAQVVAKYNRFRP